MLRHHAIVAVTLATAASLTPNAHAQFVASSVKDFSGTQGDSGWYYGYYDVTADTSGTPYHPDKFTPFPPEAFSGTRWSLTGTNTQIRSFGQAPSGPGNGPEHWAIRRWVAPQGRFTLSGEVASLDRRGNGTTARIFVDGIEIYDASVLRNSRASFALDVWLHADSTVDFTLESNGDDRFDLTRFLVTVTPTPCPADLDRNGQVNIWDLLIFLDEYFRDVADFDLNGTTDIFDLIFFMESWNEAFYSPRACPV